MVRAARRPPLTSVFGWHPPVGYRQVYDDVCGAGGGSAASRTPVAFWCAPTGTSLAVGQLPDNPALSCRRVLEQVLALSDPAT